MFESLVMPKKTFFECIKTFDVQGVMHYIKLMNFSAADMVTFFAIGLLAGFLCKRYVRSALMWAVIAAILVVVLDYLGVVAIQWDTIQGVVGAHPMQTIDLWLQQMVVWSKENVPSVISFIIGFTAGVKVG